MPVRELAGEKFTFLFICEIFNTSTDKVVQELFNLKYSQSYI